MSAMFARKMRRLTTAVSFPFAVRFAASEQRGNDKIRQGFSPESQGQNQAMTVVYLKDEKVDVRRLIPLAVRFTASERGGNNNRIQEVSLESQGRNQAVTVLHMKDKKSDVTVLYVKT